MFIKKIIKVLKILIKLKDWVRESFRQAHSLQDQAYLNLGYHHPKDGLIHEIKGYELSSSS